jgi:multiple sugar transport system substrate-binding protein
MMTVAILQSKILKIVTVTIFICLGFFISEAYAKKKLVVWAMGYEGTKIGIMARKFEELNPGIEVVTQAIPWSAAHEKLLTSIIGGVPPDISQMGTTWIPEFQSMGAFHALDDYLKNSPLKEKDFFRSSFGIGKISGRVYGIPWYVDTRVLFYRKDILKKAGYDSPPSNWKEFHAIAASLSCQETRTVTENLTVSG